MNLKENVTSLPRLAYTTIEDGRVLLELMVPTGRQSDGVFSQFST